MEQDPDVLDTWFSSALWPFSTLGWPDDTPDLEYFYPTSTLITDRGILYFWVARMVMMGLRLMRNVPFTDVYVHGTVLDEIGRKMSKSLGNGIDPIEMVEQYGADAVRASLVLLTSEGQDVRLSPAKFEMGRNFANKVWNAARFAVGRLEEKPPGPPPAAEHLALSDRWILSRLQRVIGTATEAFESFRYHEAIRTIYEFVWNEFCAWYVEIVKFRLKNGGAGADAARSVLAHVLDRSLRLLHPICPFLTEELWSRLGEVTKTREIEPGESEDALAADENLMTARWPKAADSRLDAAAEETFSLLMDIVTSVRNVRSQRDVPPKDEVPVTVSCSDERAAGILAPHVQIIEDLARAKPVVVGVGLERPEGAATAVLDRAQVFVPIAVDVEAERRQTAKKLGKERGYLRKLEGKLHNQQYLERAPREVIERDRKARAEVLARIEKLQKTLDTL